MVVVAARVVLAMLSAAVLFATGMSWVTVGSLESGLNSTDVLGPVLEDNRNDADDSAVDVLLVGNDSRTDAHGNPLPWEVLQALRTEQSRGTNTDTIIVVRIPRDGTAAHAVSIPRDVSVPIPGKDRTEKINSVYGLEQTSAARQLRRQGITNDARIERDAAQVGRRALVAAVEQLTGVRIDHYAEINLYGFYLLTNAIGGVEVCLNQATSDPGSGANFPAGRQTLSGGDALSFVRQRGGLPRGDLDRIVRQQVFMASAVNEVLSAGTLTDPERLSALVSAMRRSVVLDKDWDVLAFAQQMQGIAAGAVDFVTIPVLDVDARNERGQSIITVDPAQVRAFFTGLVRGSPAAAQPAPVAQRGAQTYTVGVFNGTEVTELISALTIPLVEAGFTIGDAGQTAPQQLTMIKVARGHAAIGEQISALLGGGIPVLTDQGLADDRIVVLIGADYLARAGNRLTGPALLRLDGARATGHVVTPPPPPIPPQPPSVTAPEPSTPAPEIPLTPAPETPPISAEGVPCIN